MNDPLANGVVQGAQSAGVKLGTGKGELTVVGGNCLLPASPISRTAPCTPPSTGRPSTWAAMPPTPSEFLDGETVPKKQSRPLDIITKANVGKYKSECVF